LPSPGCPFDPARASPKVVQIILDPVGGDLRLRLLSCGKAPPSRKASVV